MEMHQRDRAARGLDLYRTGLAALVVGQADVQRKVDRMREVGRRVVARANVDRARSGTSRIEADPLKRQLLGQVLRTRLLADQLDRNRPAGVVAAEPIEKADPILL